MPRQDGMAMTMGNRIAELATGVRVEIAYRCVRLFLKIPDKGMVVLARGVFVAALPFVEKEDDLMQVREWEKIFRKGPPLSDAVRRVILEARERQLKLTIRGILVHHERALRSRKRPW